MTLSRNIRVSRALASNGPRITAQDTTQATRWTRRDRLSAKARDRGSTGCGRPEIVAAGSLRMPA
jgi:hypothetical protein